MWQTGLQPMKSMSPMGRPKQAFPNPVATKTRPTGPGTWGQAAQSVLPQQAQTTSPPPPPVQNNPFWRSTNGYGGRDPITGEPLDQYGSENSNIYGEENLTADWERFLTNEGFGGFDAKSNWARGLLTRARSGYDAAIQSNIQLEWRDYLQTLKGYLNQTWNGMTSSQRGVEIPTQSKTIMQG